MASPWGAFSSRQEEEKKRTTPDRLLIRRIYGYTKPYKKNLLLGIAAILLTSLTALASPYMHKLAIDQIVQTGDLSGFVWWIPAFVAIVLSNYVFQYVQTLQMRLVGENVVSEMRDEIMERLQVISLRYFSEGEIGRIISRPTNDANTVRIFLRMGLTSIIIDTSSILGSFAVMFVLEPRLAALAISVLPVAVAVVWLMGRLSRAAYRKAASSLAGLTSTIQEDLSGMKVIQALVNEDKVKQKYEKKRDDNLRVNMKAVLISSSYMPLIMSMRLLGTIIILWFGAELLRAGSMSIGTLVAFTEYQFLYFMPLVDLITVYDQYQSTMAAIERLFDLIDTKAEVQESALEARVDLP